jgi:hypothetical protein
VGAGCFLVTTRNHRGFGDVIVCTLQLRGDASRFGIGAYLYSALGRERDKRLLWGSVELQCAQVILRKILAYLAK